MNYCLKFENGDYCYRKGMELHSSKTKLTVFNNYDDLYKLKEKHNLTFPNNKVTVYLINITKFNIGSDK